MEDKELKTGIWILLEKIYGFYTYLVIQDIKTSKRHEFYINTSRYDANKIPYKTVVLYDVVEYENSGNKLTHLQTKYNLLLDEITRR